MVAAAHAITVKGTFWTSTGMRLIFTGSFEAVWAERINFSQFITSLQYTGAIRPSVEVN